GGEEGGGEQEVGRAAAARLGGGAGEEDVERGLGREPRRDLGPAGRDRAGADGAQRALEEDAGLVVVGRVAVVLELVRQAQLEGDPLLAAQVLADAAQAGREGGEVAADAPLEADGALEAEQPAVEDPGIDALAGGVDGL